MNRDVGAEEKFRIMTQAPVERLICSLAAPTIVSMLISAIYNTADTFFISKISTSASGAVGISFSLMAIIQALGFTIGMGSGNYISRLLGQKERKYASCVAATGFFTALLLGAMLALLGLKEDIGVLSIGVKALRFQCITFPLSSWIIMTNMLL